MAQKIILKAPAKVNLLLRITGKREDGFHELVTLFHPVKTIADELHIGLDSSPGISLKCSHPEVPGDSSNLVWRAALAFAEKMGIAPAWHMELHKNIPVAAGMGGGSSDAGTLLKFLSERYPGCGSEELVSLAASIGADVPFFLDPADSAARGIGEKLTPLDNLETPPMLIVYPNFPVRAAWAYRHLNKLTPPQQAEEELAALIHAMEQGNASETARLCANDLEEALFCKFPLLGELRHTLNRQGALCVHVSGSGPVLFALFDDAGKRRQAALSLSSRENLETGMKIMEC